MTGIHLMYIQLLSSRTKVFLPVFLMLYERSAKNKVKKITRRTRKSIK